MAITLDETSVNLSGASRFNLNCSFPSGEITLQERGGQNGKVWFSAFRNGIKLGELNPKTVAEALNIQPKDGKYEFPETINCSCDKGTLKVNGKPQQRKLKAMYQGATPELIAAAGEAAYEA